MTGLYSEWVRRSAAPAFSSSTDLYTSKLFCRGTIPNKTVLEDAWKGTLGNALINSESVVKFTIVDVAALHHVSHDIIYLADTSFTSAHEMAVTVHMRLGSILNSERSEYMG
jgi:hypothetical protein